ncbi:Rossmann-like and DUF2520 domain-containing protein [Gulosibacter chungangensis]|uniref:DUF2520 domain-containing protein n=1 Tax=Gulosibacter chungangensis TaxID=979746 RepID=A0A7J5B7H0_9MICO|nr:Rossmann-like and DUF2520 domain-containing protein [Gulosibacter chungangensis]KAB1640821.1 DUF2520 domain-containing protein [Gulosibacter chungangensis]
MSQKDGRLGIGIVGNEAAAPVIARGLAGAGHAIIGASIAEESAYERAEALLPGLQRLSEAQVIERSELVILAESAETLAERVAALTEASVWVPGQLVMHNVAEFGTGVLAPALAKGAIPLAIHPAIDVTGTSLDLTRLREGWCAVTAPRPVLPIAQALVVELGAEPVVIAEEDRGTYAEAITTATSFTRSIVKQATALLAGIGVDAPGFVLSSLVRSAADNALIDASPTPEPPFGEG